jgi:heme o synthase
MLTVRDVRGRMTGSQAVSYALALVPAGLLPATLGLAGPLYFAGALILGLIYLVEAARFWRHASDLSARRLLRTSFVYLPAILLLLLINPAPY